MKIVRTNTPTQIKAKLYATEIVERFSKKNLQDIYYRTKDYREFLELKYQYPTIADIAMQQKLVETPGKSKHFIQNINMISEYSDIGNLNYLINRQKETKFPKTKILREQLIKNNRFNLDYVTPKLTSKWQKLVLKMKSLF